MKSMPSSHLHIRVCQATVWCLFKHIEAYILPMLKPNGLSSTLQFPFNIFWSLFHIRTYGSDSPRPPPSCVIIHGIDQQIQCVVPQINSISFLGTYFKYRFWGPTSDSAHHTLLGGTQDPCCFNKTPCGSDAH